MKPVISFLYTICFASHFSFAQCEDSKQTHLTINQKTIAEDHSYAKTEKEKLILLLDQSNFRNKRNLTISTLLGLQMVIVFFFLIKIEKQRTFKQRTDSENQSQEKKYQEKIAAILKGFRHDFTANNLRLNRILHDDLCPRIINIKREMEYFLTVKKVQVLHDAIRLTDRLYDEARALINNEETSQPESEWLQNIMLIINQHKRIGAFEINEHIHLQPEEISPQLGKQLAIIINVLLDNIEKHSYASQASLDIIKEDDVLFMIIDDNGAGFTLNQDPKKGDPENCGIGLKNVKYRVEKTLEGVMKIDATPGKGTSISIEIPLPKNNNTNGTERKDKSEVVLK